MAITVWRLTASGPPPPSAARGTGGRSIQPPSPRANAYAPFVTPGSPLPTRISSDVATSEAAKFSPRSAVPSDQSSAVTSHSPFASLNT